MERNSPQSEIISFSAATHQPENVDVDRLVNSFNLKQPVILHVAMCQIEIEVEKIFS